MEWQNEWPRTEGRYWFYGYQFKPEQDQPKKLLIVQCIRGWSAITDNAPFIYIAEGAFMYKDEGASGVWQYLPEPELPNE